MSDELNYGWISLAVSIPPLGKKIELKSSEGTILETTVNSSHINAFKDMFYYFDGSLDKITSLARYWRPIQEKRPDFSKLKSGDLITFEIKSGEQLVGFFNEDNRMICLTMAKDFYGQYCTREDEIKKITRINLENKKFEEI